MSSTNNLATNNLYILVDGKPVKEPDIDAWLKWIQANNHQIFLTAKYTTCIQTKFLGVSKLIDRFADEYLFETNIYVGSRSTFTKQYLTLEEAAQGHKEAVEATFGNTYYDVL